MRALIVSAAGERRAVGAAELEAATGAAAAGLAGRGIGPGDRVVVRLPKGLEWLTAIRALHRLGAVSVPCPEPVTDAEIARRAERCGARLVVAQPGDLPVSGATVAAAPGDAELGAFLLFTSGTEGGPKAALHRRSYVPANRLQVERWMGVRPGDRIWCTAAAGWSKSLRNVWLAAELGDGEAVLHEARFDAEERLALIASLAPDVLCMSPTEYRMCARAAGFGREPFPSVREAVAAGERLDADTARAWLETYGIRLRDGYGQTETGAVTGMLADDGAPPGSMGRELPGVAVEVRGGELCVEAATLATLCAGYWEEPEATAACLRDGWWHTGDLVERDEQGWLWYHGRRDDVISSSGYRIGPDEVERALRSHPAVLDAAVVGRPDAERGQIVHAHVVLRPGMAAAGLEAELQRHVRTEAAPYAYPRSLRFVESLPRTATGKVRRAAIRAELDGA